jgi:hypothetical protein
MNGATEATLADLLATAQAMNVNMIKLQQLVKSAGSGTGGGSGSGSAASSAASVVSSLNPLSIGFNVLKGAASAVGAVFGVMGSILGQVVGVATGLVKSLYSLGVATAISGTKLSEFYEAFAGLPIIGKAFSILSDIIRYQEQLLSFFQQITMNGAGFSGSLSLMKAAATRSYMTMQDFAAIVKSNSDVFATMGGTVMTGINRFVDAQNKMLGPRSEYANMLYGLGFNAKTAGDLLASYMRNQAMVNKEEQQSTEEIIKGTAEYARNLNTLSQLTGKDVDTLKKQAEEIAKESAYQIYKTTITGEKAQTELDAITALNATLGKSVADQFRDSYAANIARTKEQQIMAVYSNNQSMNLVETVRNMVNSGKGTAEVVAFIKTQGLGIGAGLRDNFNALGGARAIIDKTVANTLLTGVQYASGQKDLITLQKNEAKIKKEQVDAAKGNAAALERAEQGMRNFGEQMLMLASQIIGPFIPYLQKFATLTVDLVKYFGNLATELTKKEGFKDAIKGIADWFSTTFSSLKKSSDPKDFFNRLGTQLNVAYDAMKPALMAFMEKVAEIMKPFMIQMVEYVGDAANAWLYSVVGNKFGAEDPAERAKFRETTRGLNARISSIEDMRADYERKKAKDPNSEEVANMRTGLDELSRRLYADVTKLVEGPNTSTKKWAEATRERLGKQRHSGTIGMTGNWWEKSDATLDVQAGEGVFTKQGVTEYAVQNGLAESIQQLNNMMALQVKYTREAVEYAKRNVDATKGLSGNLFA